MHSFSPEDFEFNINTCFKCLTVAVEVFQNCHTKGQIVIEIKFQEK